MTASGELLYERCGRAVSAGLRQPVLPRLTRGPGGDDARAHDPDPLRRAHQRRRRTQRLDQLVARKRRHPRRQILHLRIGAEQVAQNRDLSVDVGEEGHESIVRGTTDIRTHIRADCDP
ncbi:hypothetical protein [Microbacterium sp. NPDC055521]